MLSIGAVMAGAVAFSLLPNAAGNLLASPFVAGPPPAPIPHPEVPRMAIDEAKKHPEALFVDVRSETEYKFSHITGAMLVPEDRVGSSLAKLPKDRLIILYCT